MVKAFSVLFAILIVFACSGRALACHGACCLPDGSCVDNLDVWECDELEGQHMGEGVLCGEVDCAPPAAACRVTGGGVDCYGGVYVPGECQGAVGRMKKNPGIDTSTFGGQLGALRYVP